MKITTSKKFAINLYDVAKGGVVAGITAGIAVIGQLLESWTHNPTFSFDNVSLGLVIRATFGSFASYLIKNYFSGSKVIAKIEPPESVEEVSEKLQDSI